MAHFGLLLGGNLFAFAILPLGAVATAAAVRDQPWGLLNQSWMPIALQWALTLLIFDAARYGQHWLMHRFDLLWRVHRVHHSDPDFDASTGLRMHPFETLFASALFIGLVALTAPPPDAMAVTELMYVFQSFYLHGNVKAPDRVERFLRRFWITPEMHRIHHSADESASQTNFGVLLPWWDRLLGTYRHAPPEDAERMAIGLEGYRDNRMANPLRLLAMPFWIGDAEGHGQAAAAPQANVSRSRTPIR
jgi:sterol desaturase/sphingolipid hydroxylase (fatty acid hydroxylase superfamily)